jgi:hypothetical protein
MADIAKLVDALSALTVLEAADLALLLLLALLPQRLLLLKSRPNLT